MNLRSGRSNTRIGMIGGMHFTEKMMEVRDELIDTGHDAFATRLAEPLAGRTDKEEEGIKACQKEDKDAIREFWKMMQAADAVPVLDLDRRGVKNHIGGNTLMEIGFAHMLDQRTCLYNPIPDIPCCAAGIRAVRPAIVNGVLSRIR